MVALIRRGTPFVIADLAKKTCFLKIGEKTVKGCPRRTPGRAVSMSTKPPVETFPKKVDKTTPLKHLPKVGVYGHPDGY